MTNAQLLRGERYEITPGYQGEPAPSQASPPAPPMSDDRAPAASPQPSYASLLAESRPQPRPSQPAPADAAMLAPQAAASAPQESADPPWMNPRRKAMYEKAKAAYSSYQQAVDQRRKIRKQSREYNTLYNQMQAEKGKADQIESMMTNYKDIFRPEDPRTLSMIKQQMGHFENSERIRGELHRKLQKFGVKVNPKADLPEDPFGDAGDEQFDQFIRDGYNDALLYDSNR